MQSDSINCEAFAASIDDCKEDASMRQQLQVADFDVKVVS